MKRILFLILLFAYQASATTYYLDAGRPNDSGDGLSVGAAKKTWGAMDTLLDALGDDGAGDTVLVYTGDYDNLSGGVLVKARDEWLTIKAADSEVPDFDYINLVGDSISVKLQFEDLTITPTHVKGYCVRLQNFSDVNFVGLDCIGDGYTLATVNDEAKGFWFYNGASDVDVKECTVRAPVAHRLGGFSWGIHLKANDISISDCNITDCHIGIQLSDTSDNTNISIEDSKIHNLASDGIIVIDANNLLISGCEFYDLNYWVATLSETPTDTIFEADGLEMNNGAAEWNTAGDTLATSTEIFIVSGNNVITGDNNVYVTVVSDTKITLSKTVASGGTPSNVVYYFQGGVHTDHIQFNASTVQNTGVTISGNLFYNSDTQIMWLNDTGTGSDNLTVENNIFYRQYSDGDDEYLGTVLIGSTDGAVFRNNIVSGRLRCTEPSNTDITIKNNIISYLQLGYAGSDSYTHITEESYNIVNRQDTGMQSWVYDGTSDFLDGAWDNATFRELFSDFDANDFTHASASSLGVGHGDPENSPSTDILGVSRDASPDAGAYENIEGYVEAGPPTPNPATWATDPAADGENAITMVATEGTDANAPIMYYFDETTGNPGSDDSDWQLSTSYTDANLDGGVTYTYRLQLRDASDPPETGVWSDSNSVVVADTAAPEPDPATFSVAPTALNTSSIIMTATTAADGGTTVEYNFTETTDNQGASNSGWQSSPIYIDTGLASRTQYTYTVQARDTIPNTGTASSSASATTDIITGIRSRYIEYRITYRTRHAF